MVRARLSCVRLLLAALLCAAAVAGCAVPAAPPADAGPAVRRAVADWAASPAGRPAGIPLEEWSYEVTSVRRSGPGAVAAARLRYRLAGYDAVPDGGARALDLAEDGGRWRVTADRPAPGAPAQPWDQGPVTVVRGAHALVLGTGQDRPLLEAVAELADRAVPDVSAAWPGPWPGRVVVLVPGSLEAMAALLGRPAAEFRGLAAVTTAKVGGGAAPADRVVVNPEGWAQLSPDGRRIVLTHEVTHVATRIATTARTPLWLSEGFADWAAYRGGDRPPAAAAPALAREVRGGRVPAALPADAEFSATGADPDALARAYEGAWLACRSIAARWGDAALVRLYGAAGGQDLPAAVSRTLHTDLPDLLHTWHTALRTDLGPPGA
ncbi:hypothetical protein [Streptomyces sp. WAC06614]|uniref:hypothetical protein n=1 Tax=Streptomyces sp. WAC06614 TaxID=2487416 RepID=UPI000F774AA6|nr:hypothetical protein [Streptomyces sp. WAC06614]RSS83439.1 hypothetical protein EF918_03580 [Streptomyces sp. WAC06614]